MAENSIDARIEALTVQVNGLIFAVKAATLALVFLFSAFNIRMALLIPYYGRLTADLLPGKKLPPLTLFLFEHAQLLPVLAYLWPLAAVLLVIFGKKLVRTVLLLIALTAVVFIQLTLTGQGLITPVVDAIGDMGDRPGK